MGLDHLSCFNGTNCPFIYREDAPSEPLKLIGADHYQSAAGCIEPFTSCFRFTSRTALSVAIGTDPCGPLRAPPPACQEESASWRMSGSAYSLGLCGWFLRGCTVLVVVRRPAQTRAVGGCGQWLSGCPDSYRESVGLYSLWTQTQEQP